MLRKQKPLTLSIIIPVFNEKDYLDECLSSIAAQTMQPTEVIIVDNNSTDQSSEIAKKYDFVTIVKESRQGIVYARDKGFNSAQSDLLGRIDADTVLPADWVENVLNFYNKNNMSFALSGSCYYRNLKLLRQSTRLVDLTYFIFSYVFLRHNVLFGSNMVIPRWVWQVEGGRTCVGNKYHEDIDLAVHIAKKVNIVRRPELKCGAMFRISKKPGGLSRYILRWAASLSHGIAIQSPKLSVSLLRSKN
ncbi:MAG TPA: glycosyltransferase family 2 protein [Candidatus Saccharimonadales bacterium]|nr:glycosyltransferase family 2 protein [Candidatus Saccharimonadales bacterium]